MNPRHFWVFFLIHSYYLVRSSASAPPPAGFLLSLPSPSPPPYVVRPVSLCFSCLPPSHLTDSWTHTVCSSTGFNKKQFHPRRSILSGLKVNVVLMVAFLEAVNKCWCSCQHLPNQPPPLQPRAPALSSDGDGDRDEELGGDAGIDRAGLWCFSFHHSYYFRFHFTSPIALCALLKLLLNEVFCLSCLRSPLFKRQTWEESCRQTKVDRWPVPRDIKTTLQRKLETRNEQNRTNWTQPWRLICRRHESSLSSSETSINGNS